MIFDPAKHELVDSELSRFLQRELPDQGVFVYRHRLHGTLVIGQWVKGPQDGKEMMELLTLEGDADFNRDMVEWLRRQILTPRSELRKELSEVVRDEELAANESQNAEFAQARDQARHAVRHGDENPITRAMADPQG